MIWTGQRLQPSEPLYNMVMAFRIAGHLDLDTFARAFTHVVASSDALRTVIDEANEIPRQRIVELPENVLSREDFRHAPDPQATAARWIEDRKNHTFASGELLFDSALLTLADEEHIWYFNQHHVITDAWSMSV